MRDEAGRDLGLSRGLLKWDLAVLSHDGKFSIHPGANKQPNPKQRTRVRTAREMPFKGVSGKRTVDSKYVA